MERTKTNRTMRALHRRRLFPVLLAAGIALLSASCTLEDARQEPMDASGKAVAFTIDEGVDTRATVTTAVRRIGVFGYSHSGTYAATGASAVADYFLNAAVIDRNNNNVWTYSGVTKYWPTDTRRLSFFAYAPYEDIDEKFTVLPAANNVAGAPKIAYTVPTSVYDQLDILYDMVADQTSATNGGMVEFRMDHATTRIGFQVRLAANEAGRPFIITIDELSLQNVVGSGTLDMSKALTATDLWALNRPATDAGLATHTLTPAAYGGMNTIVFDARDAAALNYTDVLVANQYLMLLPQLLTAHSDGLPQQKVVVKYTVVNDLLGTTEQKEEEIVLHNAALPAWQAGKAINYQLTISVISGSVIEFDIATLAPWVSGNGGNTVTGDVN